MPTIAHRPSRPVGQAPNKLAKWLVAAILVVIVATTLALTLIASGDQPSDPSVGAAQAAPDNPTRDLKHPIGAPADPTPSVSPPLGGPRP